VVDWSRYYGLPGMIDMHTHIAYYWDRTPGTLPRVQQLQRIAAETSARDARAPPGTLAGLASETYSRAGLVMASNSTVRWSRA
jgi:hypothetical protein